MTWPAATSPWESPGHVPQTPCHGEVSVTTSHSCWQHQVLTEDDTAEDCFETNERATYTHALRFHSFLWRTIHTVHTEQQATRPQREIVSFATQFTRSNTHSTSSTAHHTLHGTVDQCVPTLLGHVSSLHTHTWSRVPTLVVGPHCPMQHVHR